MTAPSFPREKITGVVLAGGLARRMGGQDKGLVLLAGRPLIGYSLAALAPQVSALLINANRNLPAYQALGYPLVTDTASGFPGPLAGIAAAMQAAQSEYLLVVPCDAPRLPADLAARLWQAAATQGSQISAAHDGERLQPLFALLACRLLPALLEALAAGQRKVETWYTQMGAVTVDFSGEAEAFVNLNTPEQCEALARQWGEG